MTKAEELKQLYHIIFMISSTIQKYNNKELDEKDLVPTITKYLDSKLDGMSYTDIYLDLANCCKAFCAICNEFNFAFEKVDSNLPGIPDIHTVSITDKSGCYEYVTKNMCKEDFDVANEVFGNGNKDDNDNNKK